jgi:hypothetical protein
MLFGTWVGHRLGAMACAPLLRRCCVMVWYVCELKHRAAPACVLVVTPATSIFISSGVVDLCWRRLCSWLLMVLLRVGVIECLKPAAVWKQCFLRSANFPPMPFKL